MTGQQRGRPPPAFDRSLLARPTLDAARSVLGASLIRDDPAGGPCRVGRIVEVEAYGGEEDRASHARMGRTPRNAVMYGPPGIAYVYLVYGMHHCLNVVTGPEGRPAALLIRAVEPLDGIEAMRASRQLRRRPGSAIPTARLAAGPGLVCAALDVDRSVTGVDLCDPASAVRLETGTGPGRNAAIATTSRIGVGYADEPWASVAWRFCLLGSPSLSRPVR